MGLAETVQEGLGLENAARAVRDQAATVGPPAPRYRASIGAMPTHLRVLDRSGDGCEPRSRRLEHGGLRHQTTNPLPNTPTPLTHNTNY